ncbi:MAG: DPP IV N-terminal domain-containing protein, partial [Polaribacter sp.]|nr:DPP IV N-terminal domain-containing protein [Polaribacter sp.]
MKHIPIFVAIILFINCKIIAQTNSQYTSQTKEITIEEIWNGTFYAERMNSLNSMNGDFYAVLNYDRKTRTVSLDKYSYKTLEKVETIVNSGDLEGLNSFSSYSFNNDETKLILGTNFEGIYRYSEKGTYYAYDIASQKVTLIDEKIQEPVFSPDNRNVAYAKDNNIFIKNLSSNKITQVTNDGKKNHVINGITDWVYEEEFAFVRAFEWNSTGDYLAFLRFDETEVPTFSMDIVGKDLYPEQQVFKYPKAGEKNADVTLHMYTLSSKNTKKISLGDYEYIPRIKWSNDADILVATTLNRHQNSLKLHKVDALKSSATLLLNETDKAYIDITDNLTFLADNSFIKKKKKDAYNHIYHYNFNGKLINQITKGNWEVTNYYGFNETKKTIYYQSVENGSINRGVYSIGLNGKNKKLLSNSDGQNTAAFSKNLNYFINTYSSAETPPIYSLFSGKGKLLRVIKDNARLKKEIAEYKMSQKEFSTININGNDLNMWMLKPLDFDENKKYPLLMFQYSGPG